MKRKKINPDEEFIMEDLVFSYSVSDGKIKLRLIGSADVKPTKKSAPSVEEVIAFFKEKGYTETAAKKAHEYYEAGNWHDSKGNPVKNWKQKMMAVWFKDENKIKEAQSNKTTVSNFFQKD